MGVIVRGIYRCWPQKAGLRKNILSTGGQGSYTVGGPSKSIHPDQLGTGEKDIYLVLIVSRLRCYSAESTVIESFIAFAGVIRCAFVKTAVVARHIYRLIHNFIR